MSTMRNFPMITAATILLIITATCRQSSEIPTVKLIPVQGVMKCSVVCNIEGVESVFSLNVPETIGNRESRLLNFPETSLTWQGPGEDGIISTDWNLVCPV